MNALDQLPNRRVEGWRWSDLRAALSGREDLLLGAGSDHPLLRLAEGASALIAQTVAANSRLELVDAGSPDQGSTARIIEVGKDGRIDRALIDVGAASRVRTDFMRVRLQEGAHCRLFVLTDGGRYTRLEVDVEAAGPGVSIEIAGVYLADQGRHADLTSLVRLNAAGAQVSQLVRGAARKGGRGVFQGKFLLSRTAQKASAEMQHNALLMEEGAEVFAKPELEIYADDVQCAHGNTAGQMDEQAVFYLRSRGVPEAEARAMIVRAFLIAALPDWLPEATRQDAESRIDRWLELRA